MNNRSIDKSKLAEHIMRASGGKIDKSALNAAAAGDTSKLMSSLNAEDRQRLTKLINDPGALAKLMSDPKMREIINQVSGGTKNG